MGTYVIRRLLLVFPTLLIVTILVFAVIRVVPASSLDIIAGRSGSISEEGVELLKERLGLSANPFQQYVQWLIGWPTFVTEGLKSTDGGATWRNIKPISNNKGRSMTFVDQNNGWGLGRNNRVFELSSGGLQWTFFARSKEVDITALSFIDKDTGWIVGDNGVVFFVNKAIRDIAEYLNETQQIKQLLQKAANEDSLFPREEVASLVKAAPFRDRSENLADNDVDKILQQMLMGENGTIEPWVQQSVDNTENLLEVLFIDANNGWILTENNQLLFTTDGGYVWAASIFGSDSGIFDFHFISAKQGWAVGDHGVILHTLDGGITWVIQESTSAERLNDIVFINPLQGYIVGDKGTILTTSDGGIHWVAQLLDTDVELLSVAFSDADSGLAVGDNGTIIRSIDGGIHWEEVESNTTKSLGEVLMTGTTAHAIGTKVEWQWGVVGGNLGKSVTTAVGTPVIDLLIRAAPITFELGLLAVLMASLVGVPIGVLSALRQDTVGDYAGRIVAVGGLAVPTFWSATLVIIIPSILFNWTPPLTYISFADNPFANLGYIAIPAAIAAIPLMAGIMRITRAMALEIARQDYIRTAWAKGLRETVIVRRHLLKNAMIPVVSVMGIEFAATAGELVVIEQIFGVPGLGRLGFDSVKLRDFSTLQGVALTMGFFIVFVNLGVDLLYTYLDPRIRQ